MIKVGMIGLGFMGRMHFNVLRGMEGLKVTALCDINTEKHGRKWLIGEGNIADPRQSANVDLSGMQFYTDGMEMIEKADADLVVVTCPTFLHGKFAVAALRAGKDVITEKPMAINTEEADAMVDAAKESGKIVFVAQCVRFWPDYVAAREIINSRTYGKVRGAIFRRMGGVPTYGWENWYMDGKRSGGTLLDLHVHDIDYVQNLFGVPQQVTSVGTVDVSCTNGAVDHVITRYHYPDGPTVTAQGSWYIGPVPFEMSFVITLEKATLVYSSATNTRLTIFLPDGTKQQPELPDGDGYSNETAYFIDTIARRREPTLMPPVEARNNIAIAMAERESVITGKPATVDVRVD